MSETQQDFNVIAGRQEFLKTLKQQIDFAFENRTIETYIPEEKNTAEGIARSLEDRKKIEGNIVSRRDIKASLNAGEPDFPKNIVAVSNSHDYQDLVRMSLEKLADEGWYFRSEIPKTTQKILDHEYEHHVPALGQEGLKVLYLVEFIQAKQSGNIGIRPAIRLEGHLSADLYQDIISASKSPSAGDKAGMLNPIR